MQRVRRGGRVTREGEGLSDGSIRNRAGHELNLLAEAMGHSLRGKLLQAVSEKSAGGVSVRQLALHLGEPMRRVRYHLDALSDGGLVEVAHRKTYRGVLERFYRATRRPCMHEELADREQARRVSTQALKAIFADATAAIEARLFGLRCGHTVIRRAGQVDLEGWRELAQLQANVLDAAEAIFERSGERHANSPPSTNISAVVALLLFEVPPWPRLEE